MENPFKKNLDKDNEVKDVKETVKEANVESEIQNVEEVQQEKNEDVENKVENDELKILQEKYDTLNNQYIRLAADFDNFRKRQEQERESLLKYGAENTVKKLIEVLDNFDRGMQAIQSVEDCEKVKECYILAYKNFNDVMSKIGVEIIKAVGEEFDPNLHEAVMQTPSTEHKEHTIITELQKGYKLGEKVLRPTLVNVATEG